MATFDAALGSSNTSSTSVTTSAAAAANSKVVVCVEWFHATATLSSVSGGSLTWTIDKQFLAASVGVAIVSADAPAGLASSTTITLTFSTAPTAGGISVFSFLGLQTGAGSVDTTSSFNGGLLGTPAAYNSGNLVTTVSDVLVCCGGYDKATGVSNTPTAPAIEVHELHNTTTGESMASEYRIETSPSTYTVAGQMPGATGTGQLNAVGVAYKATADSGAALRPLMLSLWKFQLPGRIFFGFPVPASASTAALSISGTVGALTLAADTSSILEALAPSVGTLTLAGNTNAISETMAPTVGALTLSAPANVVQEAVSETVGTLVLGADAPTVSTSNNVTVTQTVGVLNLSAATSSVAISITESIGALTLQGQTQTLLEALQPTIGQLSLSAAVSQLSLSLVQPIGNLVLVGLAPNVSNRSLNPSTGVLVLSAGTSSTTGGTATGPGADPSARWPYWIF